MEAAGTTVIGNAAWKGVQGLALSRQRGGRPSLRLAAHAVARRFVAECFGDAVEDEPFKEEMLADGHWRLHFNSDPAGRQYVVTTRAARRSSRSKEPKVEDAQKVRNNGPGNAAR